MSAGVIDDGGFSRGVRENVSGQVVTQFHRIWLLARSDILEGMEQAGAVLRQDAVGLQTQDLVLGPAVVQVGVDRGKLILGGEEVLGIRQPLRQGEVEEHRPRRCHKGRGRLELGDLSPAAASRF